VNYKKISQYKTLVILEANIHSAAQILRIEKKGYQAKTIFFQKGFLMHVFCTGQLAQLIHG
jgi:hypothetical protein